MALLRPASPGTLVVLAATILLILVSVSTPIVKSIYFLQISVGAVGQASGTGPTIYLGTFGYAVGSIGFGPALGYQLDAAERLVGLSGRVNLPSTLIHGLTYALVIHPVAAGIAFLSLLCGLIAHFSGLGRGFSIAATWFASIATILAGLAFAFDMACFTIAKSRINDIQSDEVTVAASYGNGIWIVLAAFILLFIAGCCFGCGRRIIGTREAHRGDYKPTVDPNYASDTRQNALLADRLRRADNSYSSVPSKENGLPAFAETKQSVPLRSYDYEKGYDEESVAGVGQGYGRRDDAASMRTGLTGTTAGQAGIGARGQSPPNVEAFQSMYGSSEQAISPASQYPPTSFNPVSATSEYPPTTLPHHYRQGSQEHMHQGYEPPRSPASSYAPSSMPPFGEARQSAVPFLPHGTAAAVPGAYEQHQDYAQYDYAAAPQQQQHIYQPTPRPYYSSQAAAPSNSSSAPTYATQQPHANAGYADPYAAAYDEKRGLYYSS